VRKPFLNLPLLIATAYLSLSIAPMVCSIGVPGHHAAGHHHSGGLSHSSFCAWACQANPASGLISTGFPVQPVFAVVVLLQQQEVVVPFRFDLFSVSRGPPAAASLS
jgi:hypothetical protein